MKTRTILCLAAVWVACQAPAGEAKWTVPQQGHELVFPADHGSHPDFKIEWWYLTGHLFADERRFGFQATFFRLGQEPGAEKPGEPFGSSQIYMAHMGLCDPENLRFLHEERFHRAGWNAGAKVGDLEVFNGNWSLVRTGEAMELQGSLRTDAMLALTLTPEQPHVIFGEEGISRKGPEGTAASYYITFPRLAVDGTLILGEEMLEVEGEAWMDHEISSSQLDAGQVGWDWACIQFFDGREIMGYVLRTKDGAHSPYSKLVWVGQDGALTHLRLDDYEWRHGGHWESSASGGVYPIRPVIVTLDPETGQKREFRLEPIFDDQELVGGPGGVNYWEGACDVVELPAETVVGRAYLELTGYAGEIGDRLR